NMWSSTNKFHYSTMMFIEEINKDHYLSMYWDLETVKKTQLCTMDHKMRKVPKGFRTDTVFMGVYALFWGSEVKPFHIIAIVLVNDEFPMKYENPNEDLIDLIEVKTEADFLKTMFQVYKNFSPDRESGWNTLGYDWKFIIRKMYECVLFETFYQTLYEKKPKSVESVIKYHRVVKKAKISANEFANHYFMKVGGTIAYDMQTQARQHYGNLTTWSLNDILNKIGLDSKEDLSIEHMYDIIIKCRNNEYDDITKKNQCNLILTYCIRDCQAPKEIYEKLFKNVQYSLMSKISCITVQEYALGNMTNMINNLIVDYSYRRNINLSFSYMKNNKFKQKYSGGYVREPRYKGFSITPKGVLDFNSLYPSVMREKNI
ncbi:6434_t:CDS:1, partial [Dentiscutata heterogama]